MKSHSSLLYALILTGLAGGAQAATWTLAAGSVNGLRVGAISFDGLPAGVEIGNLSDDLYTSGLDHLEAGSWRSLSASLGGNSIDYHLHHEVYIDGPKPLDAQTASVTIKTLAGMDNASIATAVSLGAVALAPASVDQSFIITPEAGESIGMPVYVDFYASYDHSAHTTGFTPLLMSSYRLYLNGIDIDVGSASGVGSAGDRRVLSAHIGDTLRLVALNTSQVGIAGLALTPGSAPEALGMGEFNASLTLSPIPEAETWAMLLAGIGLIGLQLRRKPRIDHKLEV